MSGFLGIHKYIKPQHTVAIETGTWHGDTTDILTRFPFKQIHTIELGLDLNERARRRFASDSRVTCWLGDSGKVLIDVFESVLEKWNDPNVFVFLDGHFSAGDTVRGRKASPLVAELQTLVFYREWVSTLLIDDVRATIDPTYDNGDPLFLEGWPQYDETLEWLFRINEDFKVELDKESRPNWLLHATI